MSQTPNFIGANKLHSPTTNYRGKYMTIRYRNKSTDDAAVAKLAYTLLENTDDTLLALNEARINDHMAIKIRRLVDKQRRLAAELENCLNQPEQGVFSSADCSAEYYRRLMAN